MRRKSLFVLFVFCLLSALSLPAWAGNNAGWDNPYGSDYHNQGYVPVKFTFPDGSVEYHTGPMWGKNPQDGKMALYTADASPKLRAFLNANGSILIDGQYDLWEIYMHYGNGYSMINTDGCQKGSGDRITYGDDQDDARYMPEDAVRNYLENTGTWLFNARPDAPPKGNPAAPPGWKVVMRFEPPDYIAQSIDPGTGGGAIIAKTYTATATFYNDYGLAGKTDVKIYHQTNGSLNLLKSEIKEFGNYGNVREIMGSDVDLVFMATINLYNVEEGPTQ